MNIACDEISCDGVISCVYKKALTLIETMKNQKRLHTSNCTLLFFLSVLCKTLASLHVDFSFRFVWCLHKIMLVVCEKNITEVEK
jgi:hypothetical protein